MSFRQSVYKKTFTNIKVNLVDVLEVDKKNMVSHHNRGLYKSVHKDGSCFLTNRLLSRFVIFSGDNNTF